MGDYSVTSRAVLIYALVCMHTDRDDRVRTRSGAIPAACSRRTYAQKQPNPAGRCRQRFKGRGVAGLLGRLGCAHSLGHAPNALVCSRSMSLKGRSCSQTKAHGNGSGCGSPACLSLHQCCSSSISQVPYIRPWIERDLAPGTSTVEPGMWDPHAQQNATTLPLTSAHRRRIQR